MKYLREKGGGGGGQGLPPSVVPARQPITTTWLFRRQ